MTTYARVTFKKDVELRAGVPRAFYLRVTKETPILLFGVEIKKDGMK